MLLDFVGTKKVDRLPVIVSYGEKEQLLGVPKVEDGKGKGRRIAHAVYQLLASWHMTHRIQGLSFDTTSTNSGPFSGAAVALERLLEREILYLPCRHHVYELVLREVFETKMGKTSAPGVPCFDRFKQEWDAVKVKPFHSGLIDDQVVRKIPVAMQVGIKKFCLDQLKEKHPRDDYKEMLQLILLFLGEKLENYHFRPPGPVSHARWMAKAIYSLKMFLFRRTFHLSVCELNGIRHVCIFVVRLYVKAWFGSSRAAEAPNQDWKFLKDIVEYKSVDQDLSRVMIKKFIGHLWYLADEHIALAFFDDKVSNELKAKMAQALLENENDEGKEDEEDEEGEEDEEDDPVPPAPRVVIKSTSVKKIEVKFKDVNEEFLAKDLSNFVSHNTKNLFVRFGISQDFILANPATWKSRADYQEGRRIVNNLRVVNDTAERGVKMIQDYNRILCQGEEEKQYLLHVIDSYRKKYPSANKNMLI